jgi:hypothetical protein
MTPQKTQMTKSTPNAFVFVILCFLKILAGATLPIGSLEYGKRQGVASIWRTIS